MSGHLSRSWSQLQRRKFTISPASLNPSRVMITFACMHMQNMTLYLQGIFNWTPQLMRWIVTSSPFQCRVFMMGGYILCILSVAPVILTRLAHPFFHHFELSKTYYSALQCQSWGTWEWPCEVCFVIWLHMFVCGALFLHIESRLCWTCSLHLNCEPWTTMSWHGRHN